MSYFRGGRRSPKTPPRTINLFARWRGRSLTIYTRIIRGNNEPSQPVSHLCQKAELISLSPRCTRVTVHGRWDGGAGGRDFINDGRLFVTSAATNGPFMVTAARKCHFCDMSAGARSSAARPSAPRPTTINHAADCLVLYTGWI